MSKNSFKRRAESSNTHSTKLKPFAKSVNISEEWPVYDHPQGGSVKITPWGCLRQCIDSTLGAQVTRFEDSSFSDYDFAFPVLPGPFPDICSRSLYSLYDDEMSDTTPTPRSIHCNQNCHSIDISPSSEAEGYLREVYSEHIDHEYLKRRFQEHEH